MASQCNVASTPLPEPGQVVKLIANGGEAFLRIDCIRALDADILIAGHASAEFVAANAVDDAPVFFEQAQNEDARLPLRFLLCLKRGNGDSCAISFPQLRASSVFSFDATQFSPDLCGFGRYVMAKAAWPILRRLELFSAAWHAFAAALPADLAAQIPDVGLEIKEKFALGQLCHILANFDPAGWQGGIDGYDSAHVTGWAKKVDCAASQNVDLCLNGNLIRERLLAANFRADVLAAGIGTGRYGLREVVSEGGKDGDILAFSLRDPETGKDFAFRFYEYPFSLSDYTIHLEYTHPELVGWAIARNLPDRIFDLDIYIDGAFYATTRNSEPRGDMKRLGRTSGLGGFRIASPFGLLQPGTHKVEIYAGGRLRLTKDLESPGHKPLPIVDLSILERPISIIIPFYNDPLLRDCLASVFAFTPESARVIIIDDCSPQIRAADILEEFKLGHRVELLHNERNLGFAATVERGMQAAGRDDVIWLNNDTRVTPGWFQSILLTAASQARVATVTAMSDRAGAFSAPRRGNSNPLPPGCTDVAFARAFRRASFGLRPDVPSGNGFCMYVSRACIDEIGAVDAATFVRLYGEENDFCMRALRAGWRHLVDDRTYIFHNRPEGFSEDRRELMDRAREILDQRYPEYTDAIRVFRNGKELNFARFAARLAGAHWQKLKRPRILYVMGVSNGGTPQSNLDLMRQIKESAEVYLLTCDTRVMRLFIMDDREPRPLYEHQLTTQLEGRSHVSAEYDAVAAGWIYALDIDLVHIRQLIWQSLNLIPVAKKLDCKVVYSFHDFYALNPNLNLIDDTGVFRGDDYVEKASPYRINLWHRSGCAPAPVHDAGYRKFWKDRFSRYLCQCDAYVTTSSDAKEIILEEMPALSAERFAVFPHGRDFEQMRQCSAWPQPWGQIRLLVPGDVGWHKGRGLIETLAEYDQRHADRLSFHMLGNWRGPKGGKIIAHGQYARANFADLAGRIAPHAGLIFSLCSETWCHTLTELWACGIPSITLDFGTQAARTRESGAGWVLPRDLDIPQIYESILKLMDDPQAMRDAHMSLARWQGTEAVARNTQLMGAHYYSLYANLLNGQSPLQKRPVIAVCTKPGQGTSHLRTIGPCANNYKREPTYLLCHGGQLRAYADLGLVDGAIIQRNCLHRTLVGHTLAAFARNNIPFDYEMDDDLFHISDAKSPGYREYWPCMREMMARADKICLSTPELQKRYAGQYPCARHVPTRLSWTYWGAMLKARVEDGFVRALYHGTPTHAEDLQTVLPALAEAARQYPYFRLVLMRLFEGMEELLKAYPFIEMVKMDRKNHSYPRFIQQLHMARPRVDFGIAPLLDNYFNRGKSFIKVIEYAALGLPAIASRIVPYTELAGFPGLILADNTVPAWTAALSAKIERSRDNRKDGKAAFEHVMANYMWTDAAFVQFDKNVAPGAGRRP